MTGDRRLGAGVVDPSLLACPAPLRHATVQLAHGGGGRLTRELVERIFLPAFGSSAGAERHDCAVLEPPAGRIAFSTDSYVVTPLFFPGGDIGKLAVYGTVNDLAMSGAVPRWIAASFVLEEGFSIAELEKVARSMAEAAKSSGVEVVTGDTKVVDRGRGHGVYVTTAGIGVVPPGVEIGPANIRAGDALIVSGDLGRHGVAVLSVREGLEFEGEIASDCAPLSGLVCSLLEAGIELHCLRDLTRGGLASALNELALDAGLELVIDEAAVPVGDAVRGACELLGLDPLYVANEGRLVAFVRQAEAPRAQAVMRARAEGARAAVIGRVERQGVSRGRVTARTPAGPTRLLELLSGEQLPRIC